ncbi:MAG: hypothetical protein ACE5LC_09870 [Candidatus Aminicenantales bacterium]
MRKACHLLLFFMIIGIFWSSIYSAELSFKGYMFGEYYFVLSHHSGEINAGGIRGRHGFWFRRIYFTTDAKFSDKIKGRLRLEFNSPGKFPFDSSDKLVPFVKDAYISFSCFGQEIVFGIFSTPTWGRIENIWGYRSLEKTPLDLMKMGSSRDFGIGLKGNLDKGKTLSYKLMLGNGASTKGETNKHKKIYGSLAWNPLQGMTLEVYADYESLPNNKNYCVLQAFGSYADNWGRIGAMWARRHLDEADTGYDYDLISAFSVLKAAKELEIIARFDRMFGNGFRSKFNGSGVSYVPFADNPGAPFNLIIGAVSWNVAKDVWLIPNIKYVIYDHPEGGEKPGEDIYANLTVFFKF